MTLRSHPSPMGRGKTLSLLALLALASTASAAGPTLPGLDPGLLGEASAPRSSSVPSPALPEGQAPLGQGPAAGRDALATIAAALGSLASTATGALGAALGAGGALLAGLVGGLAALLAAVAGALAALAVALGGLASDAAGKVARNPERLASPALGSAAAWGLSKLPKLPFAALFSRLGHHEMLRHEGRMRIFDFVRERPGAHLSQIHAHMGLGWGATVYHLRRLREAQLLTARTVGNQLCHFVNGETRSAEEQQMLAATKTASAQAIVDYLKLRGDSTQRDVARELGMSSALVSWHAKRLEGLGVLERARAGRTCVLQLRAMPRPVRAVAPAHVVAAAKPLLAA